ncbi:hypothetical protein [Micromonospora sp. RV43]|uniref:hypothetical protein n=1 Tax=Micromonospora sp. RV43 TaxID=1661387 RepID=UPI00069E262F|nr:hypothetical protein [Micromonospora sp. RV43]
MAANPNPTRISDALWNFWLGFEALEPTVKLGGIYADKAGYHNVRAGLPRTDYSTGRDVAADKAGPSDKSSAIDLTMSTEAMIRYTKRLDVAARAHDPRLYTAKGPVLREFIGTKDGKTVYCYVLVGGRPLGVGADAGSDPGRDRSHLWHLHLSIIRAFCTDKQALAGVLSVLRGEPLTTWLATNGDDMANFTAKHAATLDTLGRVLPDLLAQVGYADARLEAIANGRANVRADLKGGKSPMWLVTAVQALGEAVAREASNPAEIRALLAELPQAPEVDEQQIVKGVLEGLGAKSGADVAAALVAAGQDPAQLAAELMKLAR